MVDEKYIADKYTVKLRI